MDGVRTVVTRDSGLRVVVERLADGDPDREEQDERRREERPSGAGGGRRLDGAVTER